MVWIKARELISGLVDVELPIDFNPLVVALIGACCSAFLSAILRLRHCRLMAESSVSAISNHEPFVGVLCIWNLLVRSNANSALNS